MADSDRSAFDSDQIRVFDGSEDDDDAEGTRLPVLIVIALVVLASFAGVVWLAYQKGVASGRSEPRVVVADTDNQNSSTPPANSGNPTDYKGLKIYEQPAPSDADQSSPPAAPSTSQQAAAPTTPKADQSAQVSPPLRAPVTEPTDNSATAANTTEPPPEPAKPKPEKKVAAIAPEAPKTVKAKPVEATEPPRSLTPDTASSAPASVSSGSYVLQIGSYKSTDEADAAWSSDKKKYAGVLGGFSPDVKKVDLGEKGTWYRLRIASFADKASANDLCDKLKAAGGSCILSK